MPELKTQASIEKELIEKARGGDVKAFGELVKAHQERAVHAAFSFLGNLEDARDVAQESFVKVYQNLPQFKGSSKFSTWLYRILMNSCKDFLRKRRAQKQPPIAASFTNEKGEVANPLDQAPSSAPSALRTVMNQEIQSAIFAALETLPFQQRSAFALRYLEGLSLLEIAESMELSEGAVKAHLWQAGQKMREKLAGILEMEGGRL